MMRTFAIGAVVAIAATVRHVRTLYKAEPVNAGSEKQDPAYVLGT